MKMSHYFISLWYPLELGTFLISPLFSLESFPKPLRLTFCQAIWLVVVCKPLLVFSLAQAEQFLFLRISGRWKEEACRSRMEPRSSSGLIMGKAIMFLDEHSIIKIIPQWSCCRSHVGQGISWAQDANTCSIQSVRSINPGNLLKKICSHSNFQYSCVKEDLTARLLLMVCAHTALNKNFNIHDNDLYYPRCLARSLCLELCPWRGWVLSTSVTSQHTPVNNTRG